VNHTVPDSPSDFVEAMLRSSLEADRLMQENINDRWLREAHTHTAVNGLIAAIAMENLRRFAPDTADELAEALNHALTAGDLAGPVYRMAKQLGHDPDQWLTEFNERAARRKEGKDQ
jgi:urocanate hydratase